MAFSGYAAVFDRVDRVGDVVRRGAFAGAGVAPLLWNHAGSPVGEVRVVEDARGLRVEGVARGVKLEVGAGLSVGYRVRRSRQGVWRELLAVELLEVSLVRAPCQVLARVDRVGG